MPGDGINEMKLESGGQGLEEDHIVSSMLLCSCLILADSHGHGDVSSLTITHREAEALEQYCQRVSPVLNFCTIHSSKPTNRKSLKLARLEGNIYL